MIHTLSRKLAFNIKNVVPDHPRSVEVLAFSISFILNTLLVIIFSIAVSFITGKFTETVIALASYPLLRIVSGGSHLNSGLWCILVSTTGITLISFSNFEAPVIQFMTAISVLLCFIYAPSKLKKTRIPQKYYPLLKLLSVLIASSNFLIQSSIVASAFLIQSLTLIRIRRWNP